MVEPITLERPGIVEFGVGKLATLLRHVSHCKRVLLLVDSHLAVKADSAAEPLRHAGKAVLIAQVTKPEPAFADVDRLLAPAREFGPDCVVGMGGGSTMDSAKLVTVLLSGQQSLSDVIGIDKVNSRGIFLIAVATTAGTGSEVTPIAVVTDTEMKLKKGVVSRHLIPNVAIVDPELTLSVPPRVTAATGLDALTHCIEVYTNRFAHPIMDLLVLEGIRLISSHLERATAAGQDLEARTAMALGSLYGGLGLGPVNTAAVHALAYPLGGEFGVPHGVANSLLLPYVLDFNLPACPEKYAKIATAMGARHRADRAQLAAVAIETVRRLSVNCGIVARLNELGIPRTAIPRMAELAFQVKRLLNNNPRELTVADIASIYERAY